MARSYSAGSPAGPVISLWNRLIVAKRYAHTRRSACVSQDLPGVRGVEHSPMLDHAHRGDTGSHEGLDIGQGVEKVLVVCGVVGNTPPIVEEKQNLIHRSLGRSVDVMGRHLVILPGYGRARRGAGARLACSRGASRGGVTPTRCLSRTVPRARPQILTT